MGHLHLLLHPSRFVAVIVVEPTDHLKVSRCDNCSRQIKTVWGSAISDGNARAVYYADMGHTDQPAVLAISIGRWGEGAGGHHREMFTVFVLPASRNYQMMLVDRDANPWRDSEGFLGRILDREEALASPLREEVFHIADHIVVGDPRVKNYLDHEATWVPP